MITAIVLILLIWALWFAAPYIRRWLLKRSVNYMQNRMYRSMGIDPETVRQAQKEHEEAERQYSRRQRSSRGYYGYGKIIPADYGDAVSFTTHAVTGTEKWLTDTDKSPVYTVYSKETQVTDVKYTIIK